MAWEQRRRGGSQRYYYQSVRRPGVPSVSKVYVGRGSAGAEVADQVEARRLARILSRDRRRVEVEEFQALLLPIRELQQKASQALTAWLRLNGYHNHRGEWRLKHGC